ncbi:MAG: hypothetical protein R6U68_16000 [Desulfobacteraceae bacterium]
MLLCRCKSSCIHLGDLVLENSTSTERFCSHGYFFNALHVTLDYRFLLQALDKPDLRALNRDVGRSGEQGGKMPHKGRRGCSLVSMPTR